MIHSILSKCEDIENSSHSSAVKEETFDYSRVIVKKPWGYEYLVFQNKDVAIWMLHLVRKRRTSMHCHPTKKTALIVLSGEAKFYHPEGAINLEPMDGVVIGKGIFHSTEAYNTLPVDPVSENGILVLEIESPPQKSDLVRLNDVYGREGQSYEGQSQMVFDPESCLRLNEPLDGIIESKKLLDFNFTITRGSFSEQQPGDDALVSVVAKKPEAESDNPFLSIGGLTSFKEFWKNVQNESLDGFTFLVIEKEKKVLKLSDYVISRMADLGIKHIFAVSGGGAMHLVDSVGKSDRLEYMACYHEQAAAMAAEGYSRMNGIGAALFTTGPGGTNSLTGVMGAWIDSIPVIYLSGQVTSDMLSAGTGQRQFGIQETDIVNLVKSITKYAVIVKDAKTIKYHMDKAIYYATTGRPGPVWLDIPLDVQSKMINPDEQEGFYPTDKDKVEGYSTQNLKGQVDQCIEMLIQAQRPVLFSGYGIHLAKGQEEFRKLFERISIPAVSSWTSSDLIPTDHPLYTGRCGIFGERAGNFAVQNADLLLVIGSRLSVPIRGYNYKNFARGAKRIIVDIDAVEAKKEHLKADLPIIVDAKKFMIELLKQMDERNVQLKKEDWISRCQGWKRKYPVVLPEYKENTDGINSFYFIDVLSKKLGSDAVICTDMGTSFTCTHQAFRIKKGQRLFTSSGHASMGFGLPGTIGACLGNGKKKTICISGDGGLQMNIQEFQTLFQYKLPIIVFVLNNNGYLTIKLMQQNHFGRYVGSEPSSGVSSPDMVKVANAYGIKAIKLWNQNELDERIDDILNEPGPFVCEIKMQEDQPLIPRVSSLKKPDGTITAKPLEDLFPFLDREEFKENMIVDPIEPLK